MFPHYKNKYSKKTIIKPDHGDLEKKKHKDLPKNCIIVYNKNAFDYLIKKTKRQKVKIINAKTLSGCSAFYNKDIVFVFMKGIGAPHAVWVFEELVALGVTNFLNIGTAGALDKQQFFVCTKSLRDEGTSHHYVKYSMYAFPDRGLTKKLESSFKELGISYKKAPNWTIDAPFMETFEEFEFYKSIGIKTVEMEVSALFCVAKFRKVKIAAAFFPSDILGVEWENLHEKNPLSVQKGLELLLDVAIYTFEK